MASIEYQGIKFSGGKFFIILSLLGAIIGGGWTGYKFYDDYLDMKAKIEDYTFTGISIFISGGGIMTISGSGANSTSKVIS